MDGLLSLSASIVAVLLASLGWLLVVGANPASPAVAPDAPVAVLADPAVPGNPAFPGILRGAMPLQATATPSAGKTIASVRFEWSFAGADSWEPIADDVTAPFGTTFQTGLTVPDESTLIDLRAVATDNAGVTGTSRILTDRVVDNRPDTLIPTVVAANVPLGPLLRGRVSLNARTRGVGGVAPPEFSRIVYQRRPSVGAVGWELIGEATSITAPIVFDTTTLTDGLYDVRVVLEDDARTAVFSSTPVELRRVDNTAPTVGFSSPGTRLAGRVAFSGTADDLGGSGVAAVRFERSLAGADAWTLAATDRVAPYSVGVETAGIPNGRYDLRAVATDRAGNVGVSAIVRDVVVDNPARPPVVFPTVQTMATPVKSLKLLGAIAGSPQDEAWAYGFTTAAPAEVGGQRLPYTAAGSQLVMLRYTNDTGWQVADVLRRGDGSAYPVPSDLAVPREALVTGAMTPSGEAWMIVATTTPLRAVFHRVPGGAFVFDEVATAALGDLVGLKATLSLKEAGGSAYGVIVNPEGQASKPLTVQPPVTGVRGTLDVGVLTGGSWSRVAADVPSAFTPNPNDVLSVVAADTSSPGQLSAVVTAAPPPGPGRVRAFLGRRSAAGAWEYAPTGVEAFDLPADYGGTTTQVTVPAIFTDTNGSWVRFVTNVGGATSGGVVMRLDPVGKVLRAWCAPILESQGCTDALDPDNPAELPQSVFGQVALAKSIDGSVRRFEDNAWSSLPTGGLTGGALFTGPNQGWLTGQSGVGRWRLDQPPAPLVPWPHANRNPLLGVAIPPGSDAAVAGTTAVAVGLGGAALHYDPAAGWTPDALPTRIARANLTAVAYDSPTTVVAVGQSGTIARWNGTAWALDPQSGTATQNQLNAVAFRPSGEGWAVGRFGTILRYDGSVWSVEQPPAEDDGINISSVTVAGKDVVAVAGGNLIVREANGTWRRAGAELLPDPPVAAGEFRVVDGLPDGGLVVGGRSLVMIRNGATGRLVPSPQPVEGIVVAAEAARVGAVLRPLVSVAPPSADPTSTVLTPTPTRDVGGFPAGNGELLQATPGGSWRDLSLSQDVGSRSEEGAVLGDPVLAIAASPDGRRLWAVGGYAGTLTASGVGLDQPLPARPVGWRTASIWRFDADGRKQPPGIETAPAGGAAQAGSVRFAFFSGAMCNGRCSNAVQAQPDVNLRSVAAQIAAFAAQPGGPSFAVAGGNLRGPVNADTWAQGVGDGEFGRLPELLSPLGNLPLYAAFGPRDAVPTDQPATQQWADAFTLSPAPFGSGAAAAGIAPAGAGSRSGGVNRYYALDAAQNGATIRVIVIDNSGRSLDDTAEGQRAWLEDRLADARAKSLPVVVVAGRPLREMPAQGDEIVNLLIRYGALAVFTGSPENRANERPLMPLDAPEGAPQIPVYEGAAVGFQEARNNGVVWYDVTVDTTVSPAGVTVNAVPLVESLAIKPLRGRSVARSQTLQFEAVARRPKSTTSNVGFDSYVAIPTPSCGTRPCVTPSYQFTSADPTIGDFVAASAPGSPFPALSGSGRTTKSVTSGLFCAFNSGTTTVTITAGLVSHSIPVTVQEGGFGRPCGTVPRAGQRPEIRLRPVGNQGSASAATPPPPAPATSTSPAIPSIVPPPPAPVPAPQPPPPPVQAPIIAPPLAPTQFLSNVPLLPPAPPPPIQPIPPGGATAPSAASAPRREKAHKHASQSAYTTRPAGVSGAVWFYPATGCMTILALLLIAGGVSRSSGRPRIQGAPAMLNGRRPDQRRPRRR